MDLQDFGNIEDAILGSRWDSAALAREIARRVVVLSDIGIGRGSLVAISHSGSARFFFDLFACWCVGAGAACLDDAMTDTEFNLVLRFAKPAALLVDHNETRRHPCGRTLKLADAPERADFDAVLRFDAGDPALVLFTSGTTDVPKGVVLSFGAVLERVALNLRAIGRPALTRALVALPTHFGHGLIGNALTPLMAGGDIVLHPLGVRLWRDLGGIIDRHRISFMSSVPSAWRMALKLGPPPSMNSLMRVHVGSAPLSAELWSEIVDWSRADVVNCYGMTETANWFAGASSRSDGIADGLVGKPWGGQAAVATDDGVLRSTGEGEIVVATPSLMSGYLKRPDLTAAALQDGWFSTGDRGAIDVQGRIRLTGRIKDEINRAGFKVQPAEIDRLLERHPAIAEACAFAVTDPASGEAVAVAIRLAEGAQTSTERLRAWCAERLRPEAVPEHWFVVAELPHNERGKISRDGVRRMLGKDIPP